MNAQARSDYRTALRQAEAELANHEKRGETLRNTIAGLKSLLGVERKAPAAAKPAPAKPAPVKRAAVKKKRKRRKSAGAGHPDVPAGTFKGMGPTFAYRKFVQVYGDGYTVPQIRDALVQGGVESKSRTSLLTGLHSVRRRDRLKAEAEARRKAAREAVSKSDGGDA